MKLPGFICLGVRKAGTSWLHACLQEHPQVCVPEHKEVYFFCGDKHKKGLNWYSSNFKGNKPIIVDTSVDYFPEPKAPMIIKTYCPNAKLFVVLRNPLERAISHWKFAKFINILPKDSQFMREWSKNNRRIKSWGHYDVWLLNYLEYYKLNKDIIVLFYDEMKNNPLNFIKKVYKYIGADSNFVPKRLEKWHMPGAEKHWNFRKTSESKLEAYQKHQKYEISAENKVKINAYYKPHIEKLEEILGVSTGWL